MTSGKAEVEKKKPRGAAYEVKEDGEQEVENVPEPDKLLKNEKKPDQEEKKEEKKDEPAKKKEYSWTKKKKNFNRLDFIFEKLEDKFSYRGPGSLKNKETGKGMDFSIRYCKRSKLYVQDQIAECKIDQCEDCDIVLGPCMSSVFIRNCSNCKFIVNCKQLRLRDCTNVQIMLYS